jgi:hypothetical protein
MLLVHWLKRQSAAVLQAAASQRSYGCSITYAPPPPQDAVLVQPHASAQDAVAAGSALCELHSTATQGLPLASFVSGAGKRPGRRRGSSCR